MRGLFDLLTAEDLCAKLEHDYERVRANRADVFAAFDFIVTAWHLVEWRYPSDAAKTQRSDIRTQYPIVGLCEHLAVGGKHFEPTGKKHQSVKASHRNSAWKRGAWAPGVWAPGVWKDDLVIELAGPAKAAFGDQLTFGQFADLVMDFWRGPGGCPGARNVSGSAP